MEAGMSTDVTIKMMERLVAERDALRTELAKHEARWKYLIDSKVLELTPCIDEGWNVWHENSREIVGHGKTPQEAIDNALREKVGDK
jgi:hypothetical protein